MRLTGRKLIILFLLSLSLTALAQADLTGRIDSIVNQPSQKNTRFAVQVINAENGRTVYSYNAGKPMVPASNMKIVTSAAAVKYLGADFEYKTRVGLQGDNLIVIGGGDPLLGDEKTDTKYGRTLGWVLDDIAAKLKQQQVTEINDIIIDTSIFDDQRVHPSWPENDLNKWWACEVCGLNYNGNCIAMTVTNSNGRAVITIEPQTSCIKITNKVNIINSGNGAVGAYRLIGEENNLIVKGKCKEQQGPFDVAIERPAAFFGHLLAEKLSAEGITTRGHLIEKAVEPDSKIKILAEYKTAMADCLSRCNKNSFGLVAESLLKTIAAKKTGFKAGSWAGGQRIVSDYLLSLGIKQEEFNIDDGSGLSRENKLSTNAITKVLYDIYKTGNWQIYKDSLAVGGVDGTIGKYFSESRYEGKIFGKTGYIAGIRSFSGICCTEKGDFIFSILTEDGNGKTRDAINDIVKEIFN
jgi:D-alanyl-D-alanine carboxypeptidase/D-alanyl-D-alanine-endopeptidase (penicillin-binding protein 4)